MNPEGQLFLPTFQSATIDIILPLTVQETLQHLTKKTPKEYINIINRAKSILAASLE